MYARSKCVARCNRLCAVLCSASNKKNIEVCQNHPSRFLSLSASYSKRNRALEQRHCIARTSSGQRVAEAHGKLCEIKELIAVNKYSGRFPSQPPPPSIFGQRTIQHNTEPMRTDNTICAGIFDDGIVYFRWTHSLTRTTEQNSKTHRFRRKNKRFVGETAFDKNCV